MQLTQFQPKEAETLNSSSNLKKVMKKSKYVKDSEIPSFPRSRIPN